MNPVHLPVFPEEVMKYVIKDTDNYFLDCTLGEGGHSEIVLTRFSGITVFGLDRDKHILDVARNRLSIFKDRFRGFNVNFKDAKDEIPDIRDTQFDAILIDLGISVFHYKKSKRGFTFLEHEKLDMRLDDQSINVFEIINEYPEENLIKIFRDLGEERFARRIAQKIIEARQNNHIEYADELAELIATSIPRKFHPKKIHPATKCFQALRIYANNELDNITVGLPNIFSLLKKGGRLGVITFHSLEDRLVKRYFQDLYKDCVCPPKAPICTCNKEREIRYVKKLIKPSIEEIEKNPPSRSAKLRVVEKV